MNKAQVSLVFILFIVVAWRGTKAVPVPQTLCPNSCTADYRPVCGTDGLTYSNDCVLRSTTCTDGKNVSISHEGPCLESNKPSDPCLQAVCLGAYQPVCGSDGKTYSNKCRLHASNCKIADAKEVTVSHDGPCLEPEPKTPTDPCLPVVCLQVYDPVCGSDGKTYSNMCRLNAYNCGRPTEQKVNMTHIGECQVMKPNTRCSGRLPCALKYMPVCGSDGHTYDNECLLNEANCKKAPIDQIFIASASTCESKLA